MSLILSLSNQVCKFTKQELPRLFDENGENPGVQSIKTDSTQVSWQCQVVQLTGRQWQPYDNGQWLVIFVEAHSRYTLMQLYQFKPDWADIEADFLQQWLAHALHWFSTGGFVRGHQKQQVIKQFADFIADNPTQLFRNLDRSISGNFTDHQHWLRDYLEQTSPKELGEREIAELCAHINNIAKTQNKQRSKKKLIHPIERFLDDALFRFAQGLCDQPIEACRAGDFPNPYKANVELSLVKPEIG